MQEDEWMTTKRGDTYFFFAGALGCLLRFVEISPFIGVYLPDTLVSIELPFLPVTLVLSVILVAANLLLAVGFYGLSRHRDALLGVFIAILLFPYPLIFLLSIAGLGLMFPTYTFFILGIVDSLAMFLISALMFRLKENESQQKLYYICGSFFLIAAVLNRIIGVTINNFEYALALVIFLKDFLFRESVMQTEPDLPL
jgi:hypothetical protein